MDKHHQTKGDKEGGKHDKPAPRDEKQVDRGPQWNPADDIYGEKPPVDRGLDFEHPRYNTPPPKPGK